MHQNLRQNQTHMQNLSTLSTSFLLIMSQWRDTLTALHLVDRTALTTAWTACWELPWRTEDTIRCWGMLAEEEGGVRGWICDVMRPIRQLVYLASVRGPLMAAPASYQYIVSIILPPCKHTHTQALSLFASGNIIPFCVTCSDQEHEKWLSRQHPKMIAENERRGKIKVEGKRARRRRYGRWNWRKLSPD